MVTVSTQEQQFACSSTLHTQAECGPWDRHAIRSHVSASRRSLCPVKHNPHSCPLQCPCSFAAGRYVNAFPPCLPNDQPPSSITGHRHGRAHNTFDPSQLPPPSPEGYVLCLPCPCCPICHSLRRSSHCKDRSNLLHDPAVHSYQISGLPARPNRCPASPPSVRAP